jgi:sialate O-acetylesterase
MALLTLSLTASARADAVLPKLLTDHMVLQRNQPIHIWGKADPGEPITVVLRDGQQATTTDDLGRWSVYLPPLPAGGPYEISIRGNNSLTLRDVLVGDVWMASGQSNMEFKLQQDETAATEIPAANHPKIRFFHVEHNTSPYPVEDVRAKPWTICTPETAREFSAVAYFFARDLQKDAAVPIGLIDTSWGGTPLASFTSTAAIARDAGLMPVFAQWGQMMTGEATTLLNLQKNNRDFETALAEAKTQGKPLPQKTWHLDPAAWAPSAIYNGMIAPVTPFAIRGVIWYQGESDADQERAPVYASLFKAMITSWRAAWGVGDFPFLYVQLPNFKAGAKSAWPELREAQLETLALRNTGMAIALDQGTPDNIHPPHKQQVAARLSLAARAIAFGEAIEYSGPLFREATPENTQIRVWFDHTAGGLRAKGDLQGFEVAGSDHKFSAATARIDGLTVLASNPSVEAPQYVRYAWSDNPDATLFNGAGLPASPFRSK